MSKILPYLLLIVALNLTMILFADTTSNATAIYTFATNTNNQWDDTLIAFLFNNQTWLAIAATGVTIIGTFFFRSDLIALAVPVSAMFSWGFTFSAFFTLLASDTDFLGITNSSSMALIISLIVMGPILVGYLMACMDWWANR
jgi:hypothetical protein